MAGQQAVPGQALAAKRAVAVVDVEPAAEGQGAQLLVGGLLRTAAWRGRGGRTAAVGVLAQPGAGLQPRETFETFDIRQLEVEDDDVGVDAVVDQGDGLVESVSGGDDGDPACGLGGRL